MKKKTLVLCILGLLLIVLGYFIYQKVFSSTTLGLINYTNAEAAALANVSNNSSVKILVIDENDVSKINSCDVVLVNGMGLRIDEEQRAAIEKYSEKNPLLVFAATNPANEFNSLDSSQTEMIMNYMSGGSKNNYYEMLNYIRRVIDKKKYNTHDIVNPQVVDTEVFTYPNEDAVFKTLSDFQQYYEKQNLYKEDAQRILIFTAMLFPLSGNTEPIDELVYALQKRGYNVYCYAGMMNRLPVIREVNPDAVINFPHGRLQMFNGDLGVDLLKELNIPLFSPLVMMNTYEDWMKDKRGMDGGFLSQSVVVPEIDGGILPYVFFTTKRNEENFYPYKVIPERLNKFVDIVDKNLQLQHKSNRDKRVAIFYYKGPGHGSLTAADIEVLPSLYNLLKKLKIEGYKVENLPDNLNEFKNLIYNYGSIFEPYSKGLINDFINKSNSQKVQAKPVFISQKDYEKMFNSHLNKNMRDAVEKKYGDISSDYMSFEQNNESYLAVAKLDFGNVVLLPQPLPAAGDNTFQIIHGANVAPPHSYIAPYLWMQDGFKADAVIHFGTHGSLEFTPGKAVALSDEDWSDILIGSVPHVYIYAASDVGEGIIAKRRSYATLVNHLTPPFIASNLQNNYNELFNYISTYYKSSPKVQNSLAKKIKNIVVKNGIHRDLGLDSNSNTVYTEAEINKIENYAEEVAKSKVTGNLYTLGVPYSTKEINETTIYIASEPIAAARFEIDVYKNKVSAKERKNNAFFNRNYLTPAMDMVKKILNNQKPALGIDEKDMEKAEQYSQMLKEMSKMPMMANNTAQAKSSVKSKKSKKQSGGHPWWIPKIGKRPDMAKNMEEPKKDAVKSKKDTIKASKGESKPNINEKDVKYYNALLAYKKAVDNAVNYSNDLKNSPDYELNSVINALNGGYVHPSSGGDILSNPNVLPTGRNMYSINIEAVPTPAAWEVGKRLADDLIKDYQTRHKNQYPKRVNITLWSGAFIESEGASIAQCLYLLGVEPIYDAMGRVNELALIESSKLGRPRIDVVVQTSGQLRDIAASRLFLVSKAVSMAAEAKDDSHKNYVKETTGEAEKDLIKSGLTPKEAKQAARYRIFGGVNGMYGTGITGMIQSSDQWSDKNEIADAYINNMGANYDTPEDWGENIAGGKSSIFKTMLKNTDAVVHSRQSNVWGALSLDHVYEFMGGVNLAVKSVTGKEPEAYFNMLNNRHNPKIQELKENVGIEARTTILNPTYIKEKMKGSEGAAEGITGTIENMFGWEVTRENLIEDNLWNDIYNIYVKDSFGLKVQEFYEDNNPYAMEEMTAIMLETVRKGYWKASDEQIKTLASLHTELIEKYGISGNRKTANNVKLQDFIMKNISSEKKNNYNQAINQANKINNKETGKNVVLKKDKTLKQQDKNIKQTDIDNDDTDWTLTAWLIGGFFVILGVIIIILRKKNKKNTFKA